MDDASPIPEELPNRCPSCNGVADSESLSGDVPCPRCGHPLWFLKKSVGEVYILAFLPGLMSASESIERLGEIHSAVGGARHLILDCSNLRIITSIFLGMLVMLHKRISVGGGTIKLCGLTPEAADVFRITKLHLLFDIYDDPQGALASF